MTLGFPSRVVVDMDRLVRSEGPRTPCSVSTAGQGEGRRVWCDGVCLLGAAGGTGLHCIASHVGPPVGPARLSTAAGLVRPSVMYVYLHLESLLLF